MEILELITEQGFVAVIAAVIVCLLVGLTKLPIKHIYNKKKELAKIELVKSITKENETEVINQVSANEVKYRNSVRTACLVAVVIYSFAAMLIYYGTKFKSWSIFANLNMYYESFATILATSAIYKLYESIGLKKLVLKIAQAIKIKTGNKNNKLLNSIIEILETEIHLPLTDEQKELLSKKINNKKNEKS